MRFLILNTDYPEFLRSHYAASPGLDGAPYDEQMRARNESLFGLADFCSSNLRRLGHEAWEIYANNEFMQKAWAREHGVPFAPRRRSTLPGLRRWWRSRGDDGWFTDILAGQIAHYHPDVVLNQAMDGVPADFLQELKPHMRLLVGQHASPLPPGQTLDCYDLLISSLPNLVDHFRRLGVPAELHRLAFEPRVLSHFTTRALEIPVSFVGSISSAHQARVRLLEQLCGGSALQVWGPGADSLPDGACLRSRHRGQAWALDMYRVLHRSKITLNHHIDMAGCYANNMRLFEATGVGTLLLTDWKVNLEEMFEPGREVVTYRTSAECAELIEYYVSHDAERQAIAGAGQRRTLREHTYDQRMGELADLVCRYI